MKLITKCVNEINPVFSWILKDCDDKIQTSYRLTVYKEDHSVLFDSGLVESDNSVNIKYNGTPLRENSKYYWQVSVSTEKNTYESEVSSFITGLRNTNNLKWICADKKINSPIIHKDFVVDNIHEYVSLNICGLGYFEVYINDTKVSDELMNPVRTDYSDVEYRNLVTCYTGTTRKSYKYLCYEVSEYLKPGKNKISVWLGNGWYIQNGRNLEGNFYYGEELKAFFKLVNGAQIVESDNDCYCTQSPIIYDNIFYGEKYDARITGKDIYPVRYTDAPTGIAELQLCPPERIIKTYTPKTNGNIYDAGLCLTGFAEFTCIGTPGDEIQIFYSEDVDQSGELDYRSTVGYVDSDKNQIQSDTYIIGSTNEESYKPRFVWHAFRYFKICAPEGVIIKDVKVHYVCTDVKARTHFECSSELLNQIHNISINTQLTNTHGCMPMDCPHRERLGYTGDGQLSSLSVMYNFDAHQMYRKWINDIFDAQDLETGFVPHTAPFSGGEGGPGWGSSVAIVPWNLYMQYGDTDILFKAHPHIEKWLEYLSSKRENGFVMREQPGSWGLGDWCMPSKYPWSEPHLDEIKIPPILVNTVYFIYCCDIYIKISEIMNVQPKSWIVNERKISVDAVNSLYENGNYANGEQGSNVFPLFAGIALSEEDVLKNTINILKSKDYCFQTGLSGTSFTLRVLDKYNRNDIAVKMMLCTEYPSFGNMIKNGATSLWETWEGNGSRNHTAFSSADAWLCYGLAGIKPSGGYKEFSLKPYFAEELSSVKMSLDSEYGTILISWERKENGIETEIKVPFNTTAHVNLNGKCFDLKAGTYKEVI